MPDGLNDFGQGVLKAYLARQELDQRATQLAQEHEQAQNLLKFHYKELDSTAKQHKETLDLQKALFKQKMQEHYNELYGNVQSAPESAQYQTAGTQVSPDQPQGIIDQTPGTQGGVQADQNIGVLPGIQHQILTKANPWQINPDETKNLGIGPLTIDPEYQNRMRGLGQVQAQIAGQKASEEAKAEAPYKINVAHAAAVDKYNQASDSWDAKLNQLQLEYNRKGELQDKKDTLAMTIQGMKDAIKLATANNTSVDPDEILANYHNVTTGKMDINQIPQKQRGPVSVLLYKNGERPFTKKNAEDLGGIAQLDGVFEDMRQVANGLPPASKGMLGQLKNKMSTGFFLPTDLRNRINDVKARSPQIVRNIMGIGSSRVTNNELAIAMTAMTSGGMTQEQANENIDKLERDAKTRVLSDQFAGMNWKQKSRILNEYGFTGKFKIPMVAPDGKTTGDMPAENVDKAMEQGYTMVK